LINNIPATFSYQTTDAATNLLTGTVNTPVDIPAGMGQTFLYTIIPTAAFTPTEIQLLYTCSNADPASQTVGVNTVLLSASAAPVPDIVALAATSGPTPGTVSLDAMSRAGAFAVATVNIGIQADITVTADTGNAQLPVTLFICQTDSMSGQCLMPPAASVTTTIAGNATPTFAIFVNASAPVVFDPAVNRIFVRFRDNGDVTRGSTSVAVEGM
jgi:hypothetical protein